MASKKRYDSIDLIKVICAFGIAMMHMQANGKFNIGTEFTNVISFFTNFVFLFMLISAFGLCCGYYERFINNTINLTDFYKKRVAKILPFFAVLVVMDLIISPSIGSIFEAFADLTLLFGLMPNIKISVIGVGWFIGVIFLFYIMFPFFCTFLINTKRRAWMTFILSVIYNIVCIVYFNQNRQNILFCSPFLVMGGICYLYRETITEFVSKRKVISLIFCLVISSIFVFLKHTYTKLGLFEYVCQLIVFTIWFIFLISLDLRLASTRTIKFLSGISMEFYLSQMVIYRLLEKAHLLYIFGKGYVGYFYLVVIDSIGTIIFSVIVSKAINYISALLRKK